MVNIAEAIDVDETDIVETLRDGNLKHDRESVDGTRYAEKRVRRAEKEPICCFLQQAFP
jgi:hypothetical protein